MPALPLIQHPPWYQLPTHFPNAHLRSAVVIGAGLAGCAVARHLAERHWRVEVLEHRSQIAGGASGNPAGIFKPQVTSEDSHVTHYYKYSYQYFIDYLEKLLEGECSFEHDFCPLLGIDGNPSQTARFIAESNTPTSLKTGWLVPAEFCRAQINHPNIHVRTDIAIASLQDDEDGWRCLDAHGAVLCETPVLIVATGSASIQFQQTRELPLQPLAGQITLLDAEAIQPAVTDIHCDRHFIIPQADGSYVCGATHHRTPSLRVNDADHRANLDACRKLLPRHTIDANKILGGRTSTRCVSPDHLPIAGAVPDFAYYEHAYDSLHHGRPAKSFPPARYLPGLYVISALGAHGISLSPFLGHLLSDIILNSLNDEKAAITELLHPARFHIRRLRRKPADRSAH